MNCSQDRRCLWRKFGRDSSSRKTRELLGHFICPESYRVIFKYKFYSFLLRLWKPLSTLIWILTKKRYICACAELNRNAPLSLSTFESFNLEYYDKTVDPKLKVSPYDHMSRVLRYCQNYADNFNSHSESILMKGATGLGKTHLSLAIANEAIKRGYGVIYASAPQLVSKLEKIYFSNKEDDSTFDMLVECDLLIIDDLGTEFHSQFSVSQLYNIFNSRMLSNKPVIINTNLTIRDLQENYTDRFVSRICGNARQLDFLGRDIRIRRK